MRTEFGSPTSRLRVWIFLIREDCMLAKAKQNFKKFMETILGELRMKPDVEWRLN